MASHTYLTYSEGIFRTLASAALMSTVGVGVAAPGRKALSCRGDSVTYLRTFLVKEDMSVNEENIASSLHTALPHLCARTGRTPRWRSGSGDVRNHLDQQAAATRWQHGVAATAARHAGDMAGGGGR